ncbi:MAG TPA: tetratricopeptide repeat protein [Bryobacteraceae bacterium]|jgi:tetratricopeptide (TPR) repeat protein|nr:tetratricopeptide repeat protein [Bryobacteraceae bacterium]
MPHRVLAAVFLSAFACAAARPVPPDFAHDVAPLLYRDCAPCHHPGGPAPFALLTYRDAARRAAQIASVTHRRYMPPWLPEAGYGDFADARRLTDSEIRLLADWAAAGAPEGPPGAGPVPPAFTDGWQLGTPDLVLEAAAPFTVPAAGPDLFWNFLFTPKLSAPRYVRAVEIRPGNRRVVHHANLLVDRAGSAHRAAAGGSSGFAGMDLTVVRSPFDPDGHFLFWKPGAPPRIEPDGFSWRLLPGDTLVLNTHLHPTGKPEEARPSIGIYFTDTPPAHFPLLVQLEYDAALRIPAGARDFVIADDFRLPMDCDVLAVYPHAHYLGKLLEAYATLPDGTRRWLIRIPDWDLNWQAVYDYRDPVALPKGAVISMRWHYDNTAANVRNPNHPPHTVVSGNQATDEMGHLWLELLPKAPGDRRIELQEAVMRHRLEKYPQDFAANFNLGALALARLDAGGAVAMLEEAVRLDPARPDAHNMLGSALARVGRIREALDEFRTALRQQPDFANARLNLASTLLRAGQFEEAIADYRQVLAALPADQSVRDAVANAAQMMEDRGREAEAEALRHTLRESGVRD